MTVAKKETQEYLSGYPKRLDGIFPATSQITHRFIFGSRDVNCGQLASTVQSSKIQCLPAVVLDPVPTFMGDQ
jgi:hypothetical protein